MIHTTRMLLVPEELFKRMQAFYNKITGADEKQDMGKDIQNLLEHQQRKAAQKIAEDSANTPFKVELSGLPPQTAPPPPPQAPLRKTAVRRRGRPRLPHSTPALAPVVEQPNVPRIHVASPPKAELAESEFPPLSQIPGTSQQTMHYELAPVSSPAKPPAFSSSSASTPPAAAEKAFKATPRREAKKKLRQLIDQNPEKFGVLEDVIFHPASGDIVKHSNVNVALEYILGINPLSRAPNGTNILKFALENEPETREIIAQIIAQREDKQQKGRGRFVRTFQPRLWPMI